MTQRNVHLEVRDLSKVFAANGGQTTAFQQLNLAVNYGEFFAILGPSGCGKTSLLRVLADLDQASSGMLTFYRDEQPYQPRIGMVFQEHGLYPWMTLAENIAFVLTASRHKPAENAHQLANDYLARVGLAKFTQYLPGQISGGMRQRVSIARALAVEADILLMDEPFVFLDYQTRCELQALLMQIWQETGITIVFVTHDIEEAVALADTIYLMTAHPGMLKERLDIQLPRPRDVLQVKALPAFTEYTSHLMHALKQETLQKD